MNAGRLGTKRAAFLFACLSTAAISAQSAPRASQQFEIASVSLDGALTPIAAYDQGEWTEAWSAWSDVPDFANLPSVWQRRGVSIPDRGQALPLSDGRPVEARVTGHGLVPSFCTELPALLTDLPKSPVQTFGIAVRGDVSVTPIEELTGSSADWRRVEAQVLRNFERREAAARLADSWPVAEPLARITALYREADSKSSPLYFEVEKAYRRGRIGGPECGQMTGWLLPIPDGSHRLFAVKILLTACDLKGTSTLQPTAKITTRSGRSFWIASEFGYENGSNVIFEITPLAIQRVLETSMGGC